jgi:rhodanese-related sulfurtransferase
VKSRAFDQFFNDLVRLIGGGRSTAAGRGFVSSSRGTYAGDVDSVFAWQRLETTREAVLVDVRTRAEWSFVGVPDLSPIGKEPVLVEWQYFPGSSRNEGFIDALAVELAARGLDRDAPIFFICRSGGRSAAAAAAMTAAGFTQCFNVAGGFEGRLNAQHHRGTVEGWKAAGLPWIQN